MKYTLIVLLFITQLLQAQSLLMPYRKGKLWGYADTTGKIVVQPQFDGADLFKDYFNYAVVYKYDSTALQSDRPKPNLGVVKNNGQLIFPPSNFESFDIISRELYPFGEKYFTPSVSSTGRRVVTSQWDKRLPIIFFAQKRKSYGLDSIYLFDSAGKKIIDRPFQEIQALSFDGVKLLMVAKKQENYGVVTQAGNITVPINYQYFKCIEADSVNHYIIAKKKEKYGLINDKNKILIPLVNDEFRFLEVGYKNDQVLIFRKGKQEAAFSLKGKQIMPYVNGKIIRQYSSTEGYKLLVDTNYFNYGDVADFSQSFPENMPRTESEQVYNSITMQSYNPIIFAKDGKFGVKINDSITIPALYEEISIVNPKYGKYTKEYDPNSNFYQDDTAICLIKAKGKVGIANMYGNILIPTSYKTIAPRIEYYLRDSKFIVKNKKNKMGVIDYYNKTIIPIAYDTISYNYTELSKSGKEIFFHAENKKGTNFFSSLGELKGKTKFKNLESIVIGELWFMRAWKVKNNGLEGVIKYNGQFVIPLKYKNIKYNNNPRRIKVYEVNDINDKWGVLAINGETLLECKYDKLEDFDIRYPQLILSKKDNLYGLVSLYSKKDTLPCAYSTKPEPIPQFPNFFVIKNQNDEEGIASFNKPSFLVPIKESRILLEKLNVFDSENVFVPYQSLSENKNKYGLIYIKNDKVIYQTPEIYISNRHLRGVYKRDFGYILVEKIDGGIDYIGGNGVRFFED